MGRRWYRGAAETLLDVDPPQAQEVRAPPLIQACPVLAGRGEAARERTDLTRAGCENAEEKAARGSGLGPLARASGLGVRLPSCPAWLDGGAAGPWAPAVAASAWGHAGVTQPRTGLPCCEGLSSQVLLGSGTDEPAQSQKAFSGGGRWLWRASRGPAWGRARQGRAGGTWADGALVLAHAALGGLCPELRVLSGLRCLPESWSHLTLTGVGPDPEKMGGRPLGGGRLMKGSLQSHLGGGGERRGLRGGDSLLHLLRSAWVCIGRELRSEGALSRPCHGVQTGLRAEGCAGAREGGWT